MAKYYNTFNFIGNLGLPKDMSKFFTVKKFDSGWEKHNYMLSVQESTTNNVFLETSHMYDPSEKSKIFTFSKKDNTKLEIPFSDRLKKSSIDAVADFRKLVVDLTTDQEAKKEYIKLYYKIREMEKKEELSDEDKAKLVEYKNEYAQKSANRHEFLTDYDFYRFIKDNLDLLKQHKVRVTGSVEMSEWNGKFYTKYIANSIEIVDKDTKNGLNLSLDFFFTKDSVDESIFKESKKLIFKGYLMNHDRVAKADRYYQKDIVLNAEKINFDDVQQVAIFEFVRDRFKTSKKTVHHILVECQAYRGAERKEFTAEDLTDVQKQLVAFGINTLEDFRPKNGVLGNNVDEVRLIKPVATGEFSNGAVDTGLKIVEFEELIAKKVEDTTFEETNNKNVDEKLNEQLSSLFGN